MSVGMITPAIWGWKYRSSSWRPRKYHGAFEGFGVRLGFASSRRGAFTSVEKMVRVTSTIIIATNSCTRRCGKTFTRSPCSRWTRWMPSGATRASRRCLSSAPAFGAGALPVGGGRGAQRRWARGRADRSSDGNRGRSARAVAVSAGRPPQQRASGRRASARARRARAGRRGRRPPWPCPRPPVARCPWPAPPQGPGRRSPGPGGSLRVPCLPVASLLEGSADAAVLADPPEVDRKEDDQHEG